VFVYSRFIENPPINLEAMNPSFLSGSIIVPLDRLVPRLHTTKSKHSPPGGYARLCPICTNTVGAQRHDDDDCLHPSGYVLSKDGVALLLC
jgi:hypothetical protein